MEIWEQRKNTPKNELYPIKLFCLIYAENVFFARNLFNTLSRDPNDFMPRNKKTEMNAHMAEKKQPSHTHRPSGLSRIFIPVRQKEGKKANLGWFLSPLVNEQTNLPDQNVTKNEYKTNKIKIYKQRYIFCAFKISSRVNIGWRAGRVPIWFYCEI